MPGKLDIEARAETAGQLPNDPEALREEIEKRAYFRFCARGCMPGGETDDWLAAEQEVLAEHAPAGTTERSVAGNESRDDLRRRRRTRRE